MHERLAIIREKLDRLRGADPERRVHGAYPGGGQGHDYGEKPPLTAAALTRVESDHGVTLPEELRAFLRTVHSGGAGPGYGLHLWGEREKLTRPFPYTLADFHAVIDRKRTDRYASLPSVDGDDADDDAWPLGNGFMQLSHQGCGVFDVIIVTGELRGSIWAHDNAWFPCTHTPELPTFLDWYESWLEQGLASVKSTTP